MSAEYIQIIRKEFRATREADWILLSNSFVDDFLFEDNQIIDIPITSLRIIANIVSILKSHQFQPENSPRQLSLFEDEFETENNVFAKFKVKNSKVSPSRSQRQIIGAYEFLTKHKMGWYTSNNSKGKPIRTFGGLITAPTYDERGYTTFLMSSFWLKKLIVIPAYNRILFDLVFRIKNNKQVIFAIWLHRIPEKGTHINLETLNKKFGLDYSKSGDFCSKFLRPLRNILNENNNLSFNFSFKKDKITIIPYRITIKNSDSFEIVKNSSKISYRLSYYRKRYRLLNDPFLKFSEAYRNSSKLIESSYSEFVKDKRRAKIPTTLYSGTRFLQELQIFIIKIYRNSRAGEIFPNGYPKIL